MRQFEVTGGYTSVLSKPDEFISIIEHLEATIAVEIETIWRRSTNVGRNRPHHRA